MHKMKSDARKQAASSQAQDAEQETEQHRAEDLLRDHVNDSERKARQQNGRSEMAFASESRQEESPKCNLFTDRWSDRNRQDRESQIDCLELVHQFRYPRRNRWEKPLQGYQRFENQRMQCDG